MSNADTARLLNLVESLQRENEQLRQRSSTESNSRLMAEDALDKSQDRLQLALDAAALALWEWNVVNDTLFTSARFMQIIGNLPNGQANDKVWSTQQLLMTVFDEDRAHIHTSLMDVLKKSTPRLDVTFRMATEHGPVWVECLGEVVERSMLGHAETMVGTIRDVTRRQKIQLEIETARADAVAANAAKDEFLAHMSHEIRTPLNGVLGMNNLLAQTGLTTEQRQYVELVGSSGQALLVLVNDLLDYSRLQAHKLILEQVRFALRRWLWEVVEPQRVAAHNKGLELQLHTDDALPQEMVGDPGRLRQVLTNLLTNAIKFTDQGRVDVSVKLSRDGAARDALQLQVRDTGVGIAADKQQLVFGAFAQADSSTSRRFGGTGLGLSICERLVGLMGGQIALDSTLGQGSCFTVSIPLGVPQGDVPTTQFGLIGFENSHPPAHNPSRDAAHSTVPLHSGKQALVVDDHTVNQLLATKLLQRMGLEVQVVFDGAQAVQAIQNGNFDVVLMDIQMPYMDGWQATQLVRKWEQAQRKHRVPIIALSAHASAADREQAVLAGMDGYLTKPLTPEALKAALRATGIGRQPVQPAPSAIAQSPSQPPVSMAAPMRPLPAGAVDRQRLLNRLGSDTALLHDMARAFCTDLRERMGQVHSALQRQDWRTVGAQAHALCGSLLTLTAQAAAQEAKALEHAAKNQDAIAALAAFARLSQASKLAYDTVKTW
jgi:signal transduction histidine kinase/DNA-binding NarL/FixJ family response regulator